MVFKGIQRYQKVLKGIKRYTKVFKGKKQNLKARHQDYFSAQVRGLLLPLEGRVKKSDM